MSGRARAGLMRSTALVASALLAGCGGGGGGVRSTPTPIVTPVPTPTPAPAPAPTPAPTPTPTPTSAYDTDEYRQTLGAVSMNALNAYDHGATGAGVTIGIVDTGIDLQSAEFPGRIAAASQDVAGGTTIDDEGGHGTAVAFTAAGRRNGVGTQGVAFDATLLVLRGDTPGTCASTTAGSDKSGCSFDDTAIARGIDVATANNARVVNLSLGGDPPSDELVAAIDRATAAGIVIVIAAGNDNTDDPDPLAQVANQAAARGLVIVAGSVNPPIGYENENGEAGTPDQISDFGPDTADGSARAGNSAAHYLAADGVRVRAPDNTDTPYLWTGTSFAAPQISAAVALLAQAFPNLSGAQIVDILFRSARDAGTAGLDNVYGHGILDLTRAFQPIGTTSLAATGATASPTSNASLSAPMGDARGALSTIVLDSYARAFALDLGRTLNRQGPSRSLAGQLQSRTRTLATGANGMTLAVTIAPRGDGSVALDRTTFTTAQAEQGRAIAGLVTQRLGSHAQFAFGFAQGGSALTAALMGAHQPAFLVAGDATGGAGFDSVVAGASAFRQRFGRWGLTAAAESGAVLNRDPADFGNARWRYDRHGYDRLALTLDRSFGPLATTATATRLAEQDTVLGARLGDALGNPNAKTWFADATARLDAGGGWSLGGSLRRGWTRADVRAGLQGSGLLRTGAFAADLGKDALFTSGDTAGLRIAQPLRVSGGGIDYRTPTAWSYATDSVADWTTQRLNLAPTGRELDLEARYALPIAGGWLQTNLFWRRDPGNFADLPDDRGAAIRYALGF